MFDLTLYNNFGSVILKQNNLISQDNFKVFFFSFAATGIFASFKFFFIFSLFYNILEVFYNREVCRYLLKEILFGISKKFQEVSNCSEDTSFE